MKFEECVALGDEYACRKLFNKEQHTVSWAVKEGLLDVLKWMFNNKVDVDWSDGLIDAITIGNLEIVIWMHKNFTVGVGDWSEALRLAAMEGKKDIFKWIENNTNAKCPVEVKLLWNYMWLNNRLK